jgi:hypothetical protein
MPRTGKLSRDLFMTECPWLEQDYAEGTLIHEFTGETYGCIDSANGIACCLGNEKEFNEVPYDAIKWDN